MAQFTKYTSTDVGAPQLTGQVGSLITVLNYILVTGQSWTHPVATSGNIASYAQATGAKAGFGFVLNDNGPNATPGAREGWATGYKSVAGVGASVGSGTGQFPTAAQLLTTGHVVWTKSLTADSVTRPWICWADGRTFYMFIRGGTQHTSPNYGCFGFGEFYSLFGASDTNNCFIIGDNAENSTSYNASVSGLEVFKMPSQTSNQGGAYFADNFAGSSGSQVLYPCGDLSKNSDLPSSSIGAFNRGALSCPNLADNSYYMAPISLHDSTWLIRGRYRGLYHICHPIGAIADGSILSGSGAYAGKTFIVLAQGIVAANGGYFCIETSNTLDTN